MRPPRKTRGGFFVTYFHGFITFVKKSRRGFLMLHLVCGKNEFRHLSIKIPGFFLIHRIIMYFHLMQTVRLRHFLLLLTAFIIPGAVIFAQESNKKISGMINDVRSLPVAAASVVLLRASDSSSIKGTVTDDQGNFEFKRINSGAYLLMVTGVGYKKYVSIPLTLDNRHVSVRLPAITLQRANGSILNEVAVTA